MMLMCIITQLCGILDADWSITPSSATLFPDNSRKQKHRLTLDIEYRMLVLVDQVLIKKIFIGFLNMVESQQIIPPQGTVQVKVCESDCVYLQDDSP